MVANMAPEYGATTGFCPVDAAVAPYLRATGCREDHIALVESHAQAVGLWRTDTDEPQYSAVLEIDLSSLRLSAAGPSRPQDLVPLDGIPASLPAPLDSQTAASAMKARAAAGEVPTFPVALASITSCTNTSDPRQLVTAGLLARRAREWGLTARPWVKTSLAPGSPAAVRYLERAGLLDDLAALGFDIVGFGCATCIGNSGPLPEPVAGLAEAGAVRPVAVISGNRNFPGRVNPALDLAYLVSPALCVAYAFADARASRACQELEAASGPLYPWDEDSTILQPPAFVTGDTSCLLGHYEATPLLVLGDDVTTDHISPASAIPKDSYIADHLVAHGEDRDDLNVFASRRGNWKVMMRGAYFNKNLRNALAENPTADGRPLGQPIPTGYTVEAESHAVKPIFEVAETYRRQGRPALGARPRGGGHRRTPPRHRRDRRGRDVRRGRPAGRRRCHPLHPQQHGRRRARLSSPRTAGRPGPKPGASCRS